MKIETALINIFAVLESLSAQEVELILEKLDMSDEEWNESFSTANAYLNKMMNEVLSD